MRRKLGKGWRGSAAAWMFFLTVAWAPWFNNGTVAVAQSELARPESVILDLSTAGEQLDRHIEQFETQIAALRGDANGYWAKAREATRRAEATGDPADERFAIGERRRALEDKIGVLLDVTAIQGPLEASFQAFVSDVDRQVEEHGSEAQKLLAKKEMRLEELQKHLSVQEEARRVLGDEERVYQLAEQGELTDHERRAYEEFLEDAHRLVTETKLLNHSSQARRNLATQLTQLRLARAMQHAEQLRAIGKARSTARVYRELLGHDQLAMQTLDTTEAIRSIQGSQAPETPGSSNSTELFGKQHRMPPEDFKNALKQRFQRRERGEGNSTLPAESLRQFIEEEKANQ